ncbi:hypothetical protein [Endozoicomonas ascidiicola]|uniref:hypothetical protein n=1 Tax=Endozoicomonas ascidiicola TaxID=1698521 RepID=UPI000830F5D9|nr:hypothetical protein [Endozoicomonas ascidiicola]
MNMTDQVMEELRTNLEAYVHQTDPEQLVTREWRDRDHYKKEQRNIGIHALLYRGEMSSDNPYASTIKVLIYGLTRVHQKNGDGLQLEQQELAMIQQLKGFTQSDAGALVRINNIVTSLQVECPEGWYMAECEYGPLDLSINENRWDDGREFTGNMYASREPEIGAAHKDDYTHLLENDHD